MSDVGRGVFLRMEDISLLAAGTSPSLSFCLFCFISISCPEIRLWPALVLLSESSLGWPDFTVNNPLIRASELIFISGLQLTNCWLVLSVMLRFGRISQVF